MIYYCGLTIEKQQKRISHPGEIRFAVLLNFIVMEDI